ncbi:MAG: tetratricopeptide repeat protein [Bacteroidales bacterium]|nr:tetratricopeptide repeat protein [Bacteroidales bacterium]
MFARIAFILLFVFCFTSHNLAFDIDEQYIAFENEHGNKAVLAAETLLDSIGMPMTFDENASKDEVKAELLRAIILYSCQEGDFTRAVSYGETAVDFYRSQGSLMDVAGTYMTLGNAYQWMGNYDDAVRSYNACSEIMDEIGGPMAKVNKRYVLNNMAVMYLEMEEFDLAEEMWNKCIELTNEDDMSDMSQYQQDSLRSLNLAVYYQNLAEIKLAELNQIDSKVPEHANKANEAISLLEQSLEWDNQYNADQSVVASVMMGLAKAYFEAGRSDEANAKMDSAYSLLNENGDTYTMTALKIMKGDMQLKLGHNDAAEQLYLEALPLARDNHYNEYEMDALRGAYECTKDKHPDKALTYFKERTAIKDSLYNLEQQTLVRDFEVKYKMEEKEHELVMQREKNQQNKRLLWLSTIIALLLLTLLIIGIGIGRRRKRRLELEEHLLFVVSHDIKTPVASQSQLLEMTCEHYDDLPDAEVKENLQVLKASSDELKEKLQNIIYWVKDEMGDNKHELTTFSIREVAQEVVQEQVLQVKMKNLSIVNEIGSECLGHDDASTVRIVLQNLLSNAIKFSWTNGEIHLQAKEQNKCYWISVVDHGMGISQERIHHLLKGIVPFSEGTNGEMGTGIGLFVSQQRLDRNGGSIRIESQEGQGTTVSFTIKKAYGDE